MKRFSVHFNVHTPMQIVFLKIVGPLSKMKPCTRRIPKIGKKALESCNVQNIDNQVKAVNGAHMKEIPCYRPLRTVTLYPLPFPSPLVVPAFPPHPSRGTALAVCVS